MSSIRHVFDVGNTRIKGGKFEGKKLQEVFYLPDLGHLQDFLNRDYHAAMISSVSEPVQELQLPHRENIWRLTQETPLPIELDYLTVDTLGKDRVAGAVGAASEFPGKNCLIIDTGTCVNYDFVDENAVFRGGVISPGFTMRMKAMHEGTKGLPDISSAYDEVTSRFPGKSTRECLKQGIELGLKHEIQGIIDRLRRDHDELHVVLTGGDWQRFESFVKGPIFARPEIVLRGLNRILEYNEVV